MKILAAAVTNAPADVLGPHLQTVAWQDADADIDRFYLVDPQAPDSTVAALDEAGASWEYASEKPEDAAYEVSDITHHWAQETFYWLAHEKQHLLHKAEVEGYDALWLVDSDLLVGPETLRSLIDSGKEVVSGVFWTKWQPDSPPLPQVWMSHPYEFHGKGVKPHEFLESLADRSLSRVGGLGACTLIRSDVFDRVGYWPLIDGLPEEGMWQGEDRHFCVRAERNHVELWADGWPDIFHCYRPQDVDNINDQLDRLSQSKRFPDVDSAIAWLQAAEKPAIGDLISFTVEPLEEDGLKGHVQPVRGRLGSLRLLPDLERALTSMKVGEDRFVPVRFPSWHEIEPYRGTVRTMRVRLLDAKPYSLPPTLRESAYADDGTLLYSAFNDERAMALQSDEAPVP